MSSKKRLASDSPSGQDRVRPSAMGLSESPSRIMGLRRVHCGTHKSLTRYFQKVFNHLCRGRIANPGRYKHFFSFSEEFYRECHEIDFASLNNHIVDLDRFEDIRVTRFVRDPRDLIVSAYYYHRRAGEPWCDLKDPAEDDLAVVGGTLPNSLPLGKSIAEHLNEISLEEGLAFEFEFRRKHFRTMLDWPADPRVRVFRYEEIVDDEVRVFSEILNHYAMPASAKLRGLYYARKFRAARRQSRTAHIRNPTPGQWRTLFTPELKKQFDAQYGALVEKLGYPID